jgi:hypothetical protein
MKLIVHAGTGTVIDADDGVFVIDTDLIRDEALVALLEDGDEDEIVEVAKDKGRRLDSVDLEMTYQNCMVFTPTALRYEATENEAVSTVGPEILEWVATTSAENLGYVAELILNDELLWEHFSNIVADAIRAAYQKDTAK